MRVNCSGARDAIQLRKHRVSVVSIQIDGARRQRSAVKIIRPGSDGLTVSRASADAQGIRDEMRAAIVIESHGAKVIRENRHVIVREQTPIQSEARARSVKAWF